jgi:hypothetical protein
VVLDLWLGSDAAMLGTRAAKLLHHYGSWGKPVVVMTDRHDEVMDRIEDLSLPTVRTAGTETHENASNPQTAVPGAT